MTLKEIHEALPQATEIAKKNLDDALEYLANLKAATTDEDKLKEIDMLEKRVNEIKVYADTACERIRQNIMHLSLQCKEDWNEKLEG